ncbi:hypothetical protein FQN54_001898 [Arachnomyces sp. PD_36]|nr:hypothetical protein FQN54_001898 [Arachnomyces sp. PD_36]
MASRQYNGQRSRAQSAASNATTQTAASTASTSIPMPTANINNGNTASMAAAAASSGETGPSQPGAPAPIRRNLFHHHLSRRPPSSSTSTATTAAGNNSGSISSFNPGSKAVTTTTAHNTAPVVDNADIVVRDKNGGYRIDMPILPPEIAGDDGDDGDLGGMDNTEGEGKISEREKEKIEASLVEMMYRNRTRQMSSEPSEILTLIHQNLRNRVAELDEDKWMYEVEEEIKA